MLPKGLLLGIAFGTTLATGALSARAGTLLVTWTESDMGVVASWEQSATPTPLDYVSGQSTDVAVSDFTSTGALSIGPYSHIVWFNGGIDFGGLFSTPDFYFTLGGAQAYTGPESAPVFQTGVYQGQDYFNNSDPATVTITAVVPEASTWALLLAGFAGLAVVRRASVSKRPGSAGATVAALIMPTLD